MDAERVAETLGAVVFTPHYPVSGLYRVMRDEAPLQLDFMTTIHGVKPFNALRSRAESLAIEVESLVIAALKLESEKNLREQIDRLLAKPMHERTHFLRKRIGLNSSGL